MELERFEVGNKFGETKGEQQQRVHSEALSRLQDPDPITGGDCTPQSAVIQESMIETADAVLSWNSGSLIVGPGGPGDTTILSPEMARVASVSPSERFEPSPSPTHRGLTSSPRCTQSNSGRHMNTKEILGGE